MTSYLQYIYDATIIVHLVLLDFLSLFLSKSLQNKQKVRANYQKPFLEIMALLDALVH